MGLIKIFFFFFFFLSWKFISFSRILERWQLTLFLYHLEVNLVCACAEQIFLPFTLYKTTKIFHSILIEMKISFYMLYHNIPGIGFIQQQT